jgi:hypothetical protein
MSRIEALGLEFGRDYAAVYDSTMARFWFLRPGAEERITAALRDEPKGRILTDADLARWHCRFRGQSYGQLYFLMVPGVLLCPSFMGETVLAGMHGYSPDHDDTHAMYAASRAPKELPKRLDDLFGVMLHAAV